MEAPAEKSTQDEAARPVISRYRPVPIGGKAQDRSPFEMARDAEADAAYEVARRQREAEAQAQRIAQLLAWAKNKGLVAADATELPSVEQQLLRVAEAGLPLT